LARGTTPSAPVGVLLCHLGFICHHTKRDRSQIWRLEVRQRAYDAPVKYLTAIAEKQKTTAQHLFEVHKLPPKAFAE
jgi:hypothetical protein